MSGACGQKRVWPGGDKVLSVAAATVGWSLFPDGTARIPEPPREPQLLKAGGGLPVQELAAAFSRALSRSGLSQLDFATRLRPQLNSKSTPFFPPPGPPPPAPGCNRAHRVAGPLTNA